MCVTQDLRELSSMLRWLVAKAGYSALDWRRIGFGLGLGLRLGPGWIGFGLGLGLRVPRSMHGGSLQTLVTLLGLVHGRGWV